MAADRHYLQRCQRLNPGVLPYVSTANVARDMDQLRQAVGDRRLSYLGLSYGSHLGATYGAMFPDSYRALALEGPVDLVQYSRDPVSVMAATSAALERAKGRFLQACAADPGSCSGFGHGSAGAALDRLVARLDREPLAVGARRLDGDDVRVALATGLHSRDTWGDLAAALVAAQHGAGGPLRMLADYYYGRLEGGSYQPSLDAFFAVTAADQQNPDGLRPYRAGRAAVLGRVPARLLAQRLHPAPVGGRPGPGARRHARPVHVAGVVAHGTRRRHDVRPREPVPGCAGDGPSAGQRPAADAGR